MKVTKQQKMIGAYVAAGVAVVGVSYYAYRKTRAPSQPENPTFYDPGRVALIEENTIQQAIDQRGQQLGQQEYDRSFAYAQRCGMADPATWASRVRVRAGQPCPGEGALVQRYRMVQMAPGQIAAPGEQPGGYWVEPGMFPPNDVPASNPLSLGGGWMSKSELCVFAARNGAMPFAARRYLSNSYDVDGNLLSSDRTGLQWTQRCAAVGQKG